MDVFLMNSKTVKDSLRDARAARDNLKVFAHSLRAEFSHMDVKANGEVHLFFRVRVTEASSSQVKIEEDGGEFVGDELSLEFIARSNQPAGEQSVIVKKVVNLLSDFKLKMGDEVRFILDRYGPGHIIKVGQSDYTVRASNARND